MATSDSQGLIHAQAGNREISISIPCPSFIFLTDYKLYYKKASESDGSCKQVILTTSTTGVLTAVLTELTNGEPYDLFLEKTQLLFNRKTQVARIRVIPTLTPPVGFKTVTGVESAAIELFWESVKNATGYKIVRALDVNGKKNGTLIHVVSNGQTITHIDKSNLINGKTYYYRIKAIDRHLTSGFSCIVSAIPQLMPPISVKAVGDVESAAIVLSWALVTNATGYKIERALDVNSKMDFTPIHVISNGQTITYTDKSDLINGKTYCYKISSVDRHLESVSSPIVSAVPQMTPPVGFKTVTGVESAAIVLSWAFVTNATGYKIERALDVNGKMDFTPIHVISNGQTITYTDKSDLINGKTYCYKISSVDRHLESVSSPIVSAVPQMTPPVGFKTVTGVESAAIELSWESVTNATGYKIERALDVNGKMDFTPIHVISNGQTITYTDKSDLINGKTYYYKISSIDRHLESAFSSIVSAVPQLQTPANFQAITSNESRTIVLSWESVTHATGYVIQRTLDVNSILNFSTIKSISGSETTTYIDKCDLVNGRKYGYRIAAIDSQSKSVFSDSILATPELTPPTDFKADVNEEATAITLSWSLVTHATGYEIQRAYDMDSTENYSTIATILNSQMAIYIDKSNLENGKTYMYKIAAIENQAKGELTLQTFSKSVFAKSPFSPVVVVTLPLRPPLNFKAVASDNSASIDLSWSPVVNATGYLIQRSLANNDKMDFQTIGNILSAQTTTYRDNLGLVNGNIYHFWIAAVNSRSRSVFSCIVSTIPQLTPPVGFKTVTGVESAAIVLSWAFVTNATGYKIERALDVNGKMDFTPIHVISNGQTITYTDKSDLINGKTYYYKISSIDRHLESVSSSIVSAVPQLQTPANFQACYSQDSTTVTLSWSSVANATGYIIERALGINNTAKFSTIATISNGDITTYIDKSGIRDGNIYRYKIAAIESQPQKKSSIWRLQKDLHLKSPFSSVIEPTPSSIVSTNSSVISVRKGDLAKENVDAIIVSSSSSGLIKAILKAAGPAIATAYADAQKANPSNSYSIASAGQLPCQKIIFLPWKPDSDLSILRESLKNLVNIAIQYAIDQNLRSIAFPAIGCGGYGYSIDVIAEIMVSEAVYRLEISNHLLEVNFVVLPNQGDLYDKFIEQKKKFESRLAKPLLQNRNGLPSNWEQSNKSDQIRFTVSITSLEYNLIIDQFKATIKPHSPTIIRLERIQNERWYKQYRVHEEDFRNRLNKNTARMLYHGCSEDSAKSIISQGFNRSFAGVNGTVYGFGVYFATDARYSHSYTRANSTGESCMFVARVLIGKSILGNNQMKVCPVGHDSTTNGSNIFVAYHDAQSYAEYLITYK